MALQLGEMAAKQETTVRVGVSTFVNVKTPDNFNHIFILPLCFWQHKQIISTTFTQHKTVNSM